MELPRTAKQAEFLEKRGIPASGMSRATAARLLDALCANGWRRLDPARVAEIINQTKAQG